MRWAGWAGELYAFRAWEFRGQSPHCKDLSLVHSYPLRRNDYQNNSVKNILCNCPGAITGFLCRAPENNSPNIFSCKSPCPVRAPPRSLARNHRDYGEKGLLQDAKNNSPEILLCNSPRGSYRIFLWSPRKKFEYNSSLPVIILTQRVIPDFQELDWHLVFVAHVGPQARLHWRERGRGELSWHPVTASTSEVQNLGIRPASRNGIEIRLFLRPPTPRSSRRWNFKMSTTRHGEINWEEFWEMICGSFCTANEARKCTENFVQFFA